LRSAGVPANYFDTFFRPIAIVNTSGARHATIATATNMGFRPIL